jgi:hypothetical protein
VPPLLKRLCELHTRAARYRSVHSACLPFAISTSSSAEALVIKQKRREWTMEQIEWRQRAGSQLDLVEQRGGRVMHKVGDAAHCGLHRREILHSPLRLVQVVVGNVVRATDANEAERRASTTCFWRRRKEWERSQPLDGEVGEQMRLVQERTVVLREA